MWLMSEAKGVERSLAGLARRLLVVNFAAIHTTSIVSHTDLFITTNCEYMQTFTNVLYRLLSNPEYVEPLRHDAETAVAEEGWTKAGMDKMHKIDSFLRETQRLDSLDYCPLDYFGRTSVTDALLPFPVSLFRLALRPFTFSNGPSRITSIHIFQWSHCSCGYANRRGDWRYPQGWRDLSKPRGI